MQDKKRDLSLSFLLILYFLNMKLYLIGKNMSWTGAL